MSFQTIARMSRVDEMAVIRRFLENPGETTFTHLFYTFSPQLVAFYRARGCAFAEDLAQEVMLAVFRKASHLRDPASFRSWLFTIARHALFRHRAKQAREAGTIGLADVIGTVAAAVQPHATTHAFEFNNWISVLDPREREALTLRYIEQWEYHEIAAARGIPVGTVQWRVFNARKKLATYLRSREQEIRRAA